MAEIYEKGQVVIPKFIRDMFGFKPGTEVGFKVDGQRVYIEKKYDWKAEFDALCKEGSMSDREVEKAILEDGRKRHKEKMHVP
ncbi:MAG: AbrB/MazE/SpoVT family DNA-binding domain-containing protein [Candidatus Micrarchaeia archaeon]|jgi:AbrB family looped-hinge helix DNA binding protein